MVFWTNYCPVKFLGIKNRLDRGKGIAQAVVKGNEDEGGEYSESNIVV